MTPGKTIGLACATVALMLATACAEAPPTIHRPAPEGRLTVMNSRSGLNLDAPPRDWIIQGHTNSERDRLRTTTLDGVTAIELISGAEPVIAVRQIDAMMLATPYLNWSWNLSDHGAGVHPMRLVVGFLGGVPEDSDAAEVLGGGLPAHDRALALVWGDSMLGRGTLSLPPADKPLSAPLYTVRGGRENTRKWWREAVDLSRFYQQAWPNDDFSRVRITFIGMAAAPRQPAVRGRVAGILLTH